MWTWVRVGLLFGVTALLLVRNVAQASPATFTVNSTGDGTDYSPGNGVCETATGNGVCTLRAAIQEANAWAGADTINFNILPWGVKTIRPGSALPAITEGVTIDGGTQVGTAPRNVQLDGSSAGAGVDGLVLSSGGNLIKSLVINRFKGNGVVINQPGGNTLEKNYIGTDVWGTAALANDGDGVLLRGNTNENTIGPDNVISGNTGNGVHLTGGAYVNWVINNRIGLAAGGTYPSAAVPNGGDGVLIDGAAHGNKPPAGGVSANAIAGNKGNGVHITGSGSDYNEISGNCIGYRVGDTICITTSSSPIPNEKNGVLIEGGAQHNAVTADEEAIAANLWNGVLIQGAGTNLNSVGSGNRILENGLDGVIIGGGAQSNTVEHNHIAGNGGHGVRITGSGTNLNVVKENCIGRISLLLYYCKVTLSNAMDGVRVEAGAQHNQIGSGNTIVDNSGDGVSISGSATDFNTITENCEPLSAELCIFDNGGLGIDLNDDGVTPNGPPDNTANNDLDFPVLTTVTTTLVAGSACSGCTVEVFKADPDPSGYGEAAEFLGSTIAGLTGYFSLAVSGLVSGDPVTATATDSSGNTSEFSGNVQAWAGPVGGIAELPDVSDSSSPSWMAMAGIAVVAVLAITAGVWYARRRLS